MKKIINTTAKVLLVVGGLNWGLIGIPQLFGSSGINLVQTTLGSMPLVVNLVYTLVGVSAIVFAINKFR